MRRRTLLPAALLPPAMPAMAQTADRTFYDLLPLGTPREAATMFLAAWRNRDYATAYLTLHPQTQRRVRETIILLDFAPLVRAGARPDRATLDRMLPSPDQFESDDGWWLFDNIMTVAEEAGLLPIKAPSTPAVGPARLPDGLVRVLAGTGAEQVVVFLGTSPAGRWRVRVAMPAGGDPDKAPFGH